MRSHMTVFLKVLLRKAENGEKEGRKSNLSIEMKKLLAIREN